MMKRIVTLVCGMVFLVASTAEARWTTRTSGGTYTQSTSPTCSTCRVQPARVAPTTYAARPAQPARVAPATYAARPAQPARVAPAANVARPAQPARVTTVSYSPSPAQPVQAATMSYSTSTAQGVANIMASTGRVGHWGGNPGYEGCGSGSTPAAAYSICCYANSGMSTVDVGYARGRNGMWFCCRRYR